MLPKNNIYAEKWCWPAEVPTSDPVEDSLMLCVTWMELSPTYRGKMVKRWTRNVGNGQDNHCFKAPAGVKQAVGWWGKRPSTVQIQSGLMICRFCRDHNKASSSLFVFAIRDMRIPHHMAQNLKWNKQVDKTRVISHLHIVHQSWHVKHVSWCKRQKPYCICRICWAIFCCWVSPSEVTPPLINTYLRGPLTSEKRSVQRHFPSFRCGWPTFHIFSSILTTRALSGWILTNVWQQVVLSSTWSQLNTILFEIRWDNINSYDIISFWDKIIWIQHIVFFFFNWRHNNGRCPGRRGRPGGLVGEEVVQLYVHDQVASRVRPVRELKGFQKAQRSPPVTSRWF